MKIVIGMLWAKSVKGRLPKFRTPGAGELFEFFLHRAQGHFQKTQPEALSLSNLSNRSAGEYLILCERSQNRPMGLKSEELAQKIEDLKVSGCSSLVVVIGPADGFSKAEIASLQPDLLWCLGEGTLPHELASVVVMEQIYRALSILDKHPYHLGH